MPFGWTLQIFHLLHSSPQPPLTRGSACTHRGLGLSLFLPILQDDGATGRCATFLPSTDLSQLRVIRMVFVLTLWLTQLFNKKMNQLLVGGTWSAIFIHVRMKETKAWLKTSKHKYLMTPYANTQVVSVAQTENIGTNLLVSHLKSGAHLWNTQFCYSVLNILHDIWIVYFFSDFFFLNPNYSDYDSLFRQNCL